MIDMVFQGRKPEKGRGVLARLRVPRGSTVLSWTVTTVSATDMTNSMAILTIVMHSSILWITITHSLTHSSVFRSVFWCFHPNWCIRILGYLYALCLFVLLYIHTTALVFAVSIYHYHKTVGRTDQRQHCEKKMLAG